MRCLVRMLFALAFCFAGSEAPAASSAKELCPVTVRLAAELRNPTPEAGKGGAAQKDERFDFSSVDSFFVSLAELNGYFSGDPKLTFPVGEERLATHETTCLRLLADIFVAAASTSRSSGTAAASAGFRFIGHADATGNAERNYRLSYERGHAAAQAFSRLVKARLGWAPAIAVEGRGGADPWWCGVEDVAGAAPAPGGASTCGALAAGKGEIARDKVVRVRNDRRLEIRFSGTSIAGPRIDLIAKAMALGPAADMDFARLLRFEPRMRYFPAGNAPLQPVRIVLHDSGEAACLALAGAFPETAWSQYAGKSVSALEPSAAWPPKPGSASNPKRFDEANLAIRLRVVPAVTRNQGRPNRARLLLELATGTVGPVLVVSSAGTPPPAETLAVIEGTDGEGSAKAGAGKTPSEIERRAAGYGVPEYWRVRLRIDELLSGLLLTETGTTDFWSALAKCLPQQAGKNAESGVEAERSKAAAFVRGAGETALENLPRDFDGLLAHAHDFNRPTRMFGLRPGLKLRIDAGRLGLQREAPSEQLYTMALAGTSAVYDLYAAPLAVWRNIADQSGPFWPASGHQGYLAVSLNPTVQGMSVGGSKVEDENELPVPPDEKNGLYNLASPYALERFLRGRLVNVFLPGARPGRKTLDMKEIDFIDRSDDAANSEKDAILLAAENSGLLVDFYKNYLPDAQLAGPVNHPRPACEGARSQVGVLCGFMRQNVVPTLLLPVRSKRQDRHVPIDTRVGALMLSGELEPCFANDAAGSGLPSFPASSRLANPVLIRALGASLPVPALVDGRDCRLLGLPALAGSEFEW